MLQFARKFCFLIFALLILLKDCVQAHSHFAIVANGPFNKNFVQKYKKEAILIALDGASNHLDAHGVIPDFILGDFDSITQITKKHFQNLRVPFIPMSDQSLTDIEKEIQFWVTKGAKKITLICALGGNRNDHSFANLSLLRRHHGKGYKVEIETEEEIIEFLKDETAIRNATVGGKFGLFGFPSATAEVAALEWLLSNYALEMGRQESACNIVKASPLTVHIKGEALMIWPKLIKN